MKRKKINCVISSFLVAPSVELFPYVVLEERLVCQAAREKLREGYHSIWMSIQLHSCEHRSQAGLRPCPSLSQHLYGLGRIVVRSHCKLSNPDDLY